MRTLVQVVVGSSAGVEGLALALEAVGLVLERDVLHRLLVGRLLCEGAAVEAVVVEAFVGVSFLWFVDLDVDEVLI